MNKVPRVGIAGARGIGKHHAKWFARAGCEVVAVYGTTEESAAAAARQLADLFGFSGRAFHRWDRFLQEGDFDACSVCSPPERHLENVTDLLAAGRHVLCEKPLVWDWSAEPAELVAEAEGLAREASRSGMVLALNAQYPAALEGWKAFHRHTLGREPDVRLLTFTLETKGKPRSPHGAAEVWVDLGPHPLAVIDSEAPGGIDWPTLRHSGGPREAFVQFDWTSGDRRIVVQVEGRRVAEGPLRRRIGNQDFVAECEGCTVDGQFSLRLRAGEREWITPDPMRVSVERFVEAVRTGDPSRALVGAEAAVRQQAALVGVWERCWR